MSVIRRNYANVIRKATSSLCAYGQNVNLLVANVSQQQQAEWFRNMHSNSMLRKWRLSKVPQVQYVNGQKVRRHSDNWQRHPLDNEFQSKNAKYRWAEFRRKLVLGKFAM